MVLSISVVWITAIIPFCVSSPYIAIIPTTMPIRGGGGSDEYVGDNFLLPTNDERSEENGDDENSAERQSLLRTDCGRLFRLYERLHAKKGAFALLAEGQIDERVLDACARLLLNTNRAAPFAAITRDYDTPNWTVKRSTPNFKNEPASDARVLQRRAYDYIRFGKRLMEAANKRMQSSASKNNRKAAGTHEYIRFGKK